jgi:hypothetical protein
MVILLAAVGLILLPAAQAIHGDVTLYVMDPHGSTAIQNAIASVNGGEEIRTDSDGTAIFHNVYQEDGTESEYTVSAQGYQQNTGSFAISEGNMTPIAVYLDRETAQSAPAVFLASCAVMALGGVAVVGIRRRHEA